MEQQFSMAATVQEFSDHVDEENVKFKHEIMEKVEMLKTRDYRYLKQKVGKSVLFSAEICIFELY